jgi:hypothetical protein
VYGVKQTEISHAEFISLFFFGFTHISAGDFLAVIKVLLDVSANSGLLYKYSDANKRDMQHTLNPLCMHVR